MSATSGAVIDWSCWAEGQCTPGDLDTISILYTPASTCLCYNTHSSHFRKDIIYHLFGTFSLLASNYSLLTCTCPQHWPVLQSSRFSNLSQMQGHEHKKWCAKKFLCFSTLKSTYSKEYFHLTSSFWNHLTGGHIETAPSLLKCFPGRSRLRSVLNLKSEDFVLALEEFLNLWMGFPMG